MPSTTPKSGSSSLVRSAPKVMQGMVMVSSSLVIFRLVSSVMIPSLWARKPTAMAKRTMLMLEKLTKKSILVSLSP